MNLSDMRIRRLAENIVEHKHIITDEVVQLSIIYDYLDKYANDTKILVEFYEEVKEYAFNLKYGDLGFFRDLLENNYETFKELTDKMQQINSITESIDEMEQNAKALLAFIEKSFGNTNIKTDLLEYSQNFIYYIEGLRLNRNALLKLKKGIM